MSWLQDWWFWVHTWVCYIWFAWHSLVSWMDSWSSGTAFCSIFRLNDSFVPYFVSMAPCTCKSLDFISRPLAYFHCFLVFCGFVCGCLGCGVIFSSFPSYDTKHRLLYSFYPLFVSLWIRTVFMNTFSWDCVFDYLVSVVKELIPLLSLCITSRMLKQLRQLEASHITL